MGRPEFDDLYHALDFDEFLPYFQPLVELRTGRLSGFEVLARWNHPVLGILGADRFISRAERSGCIAELTTLLLRKAFLAAQVLPADKQLAVNVSPLQFHDLEFPQQLAQEAARGNFPLHRLVLEVTESSLVGNTRQARTIAHELRSMGAKLALDDFGTGYSSLRHLQALPFDELKVDASFVRSMGVTRESRKIAAAVIGLGQSLGLTTVAEGIETRNQAEMLLWLGCDLGQGWLYGRPVPAERLEAEICRDYSPAAKALEAHTEEPGEIGPIAPRLEATPGQRLAELQAIYDGAPVGLCLVDSSLRFLSVNRHLAEIDGVSVADHLGRTLVEIMPSAAEKLRPGIKRALAGESLKRIEIQGSRRDAEGRTRLYEVSYEPARDEAGEVVGVSVTMMDVTEKLRAHAVVEVLRAPEFAVTGS